MPKKYQLKIQPQAEADLEKIYQYIVHDKPVAAHQFIRGLKSQINSLKTFPLRGSAFQVVKDGIIKEFRYIPYKKYIIFYEVKETEVFILHIFVPGQNWWALLI